jgi:hypothetical protein
MRRTGPAAARLLAAARRRVPNVKRALVGGVIAVGAMLATAPSAHGCSCAPVEKPTLRGVDAAATMRLTEVKDDANPNNRVKLVYRILRVYKGSGRYNLHEGDKLRIHSGQESACGLPRREGKRYGLPLFDSRDGLTSNLCAVLSPHELRRAAQRSGNARSANSGCGTQS